MITAAPGRPQFPGVAGILRARAGRRSTARAYPASYWLGGLVFVAVAAALVVSIADGSAQALGHYGPAFLWSTTWSPDAGQFGAGLLVVGTIVTAGLAMLMTVPLGLGVAVAVSEFAPRRLAGVVASAIEFLAAVPSIVVGLWAAIILTPVFARDVEPFLQSVPVVGHLFGGATDGPSFLLAAVVLGVMTLPTMVSLSRSALAAVPAADREAAMALGATPWQVVRTAVLPAARSGIAAAVTLAVGRALGESIAVALVIGNDPQFPHSLSAPGATLGSAIVNQFAEASPGLQTSSVIALGAVLLLLTLAVNVVGQVVRRRDRAAKAMVAPRGPAAAGDPGVEVHAARAGFAQGPPVGAGSRARSTLGRRRLWAGVVRSACYTSVAVGIAPLVALLWFTVQRGLPAISAGFLSQPPVPPGVPGGGIGPAITGTLRLIGLALLMAVPTGLLAAVLLYERRGRIASAIRFMADVMTGIPSILVGVFAYAVLVETTHHMSTWAAAFALATLMLPIMVRADEEALRSVPSDLWEAGVALGASRPAVTAWVVLRQALPAVVSGNLLATARGVGETAPLLFTLAAPGSALTLVIFTQATQAYSSAQQTAWGAALVLLFAVLVLSGAARSLAWWWTRRAR